MIVRLAAVLAGAALLSGCGLFMSEERLAEARYRSEAPELAYLGGGGLLVPDTDYFADDSLSSDPWRAADSRFIGVVDDDKGLNDGGFW